MSDERLRAALTQAVSMAHSAAHVGRLVPHGTIYQNCPLYPCLQANEALAATPSPPTPTAEDPLAYYDEYRRGHPTPTADEPVNHVAVQYDTGCDAHGGTTERHCAADGHPMPEPTPTAEPYVDIYQTDEHWKDPNYGESVEEPPSPTYTVVERLPDIPDPHGGAPIPRWRLVLPPSPTAGEEDEGVSADGDPRFPTIPTPTADERTVSVSELERLAHSAAQIGFTYGALGRDFEYAYRNVKTMITEALSPDAEP